MAHVELRNDQIEEIRSWELRNWRHHLRDQNTGYVTNWILYAFTGRDASLIKDVSQADWRRYDRKDDLKYWMRYLGKNGLAQDLGDPPKPGTEKER